MMIKRFVAIIALLGLAGQVTSCTSKESPSDSELSADLEAADLEQIENADAVDVAGDDPMMSEALPEDALGEADLVASSDSTSEMPAETSVTTETVTTITENTSMDDQATTEQVDVATMDETLPADPFGDSSSDLSSSTSASSVIDESVESTPGQYTDTTTTRTETIITETKKNVPLQKMADTPWTVGGTLYNTIYFARQGDTLDSISSMIYGMDKTAELKKGNPTYKNRGVKAGDKVYYNSPNRPTDNTRVITYYDDIGMAPEVYVAKSGDNIRSVSQQLLGHGNAWKEIWSSNDVESKGSLPEGTELRYWKGGGQAVARNQAPTQIPAPPSMAEVPETMPPMDMTPPPPMEDPMMASNDIPPPPMNELDMAPPPPPPMEDFAQDMAPPPPPVESFNPPAPEQNIAQESAGEGMDSDTTMALGVVSLAAVGLAVLMVVRKKRKQKELEQQALDQTHVGT